MIRVIGLGKEFEISSLPDLLSILDKLKYKSFLYRGEPKKFDKITASGFRYDLSGNMMGDTRRLDYLNELLSQYYREIGYKLNNFERDNFVAYAQHHGLPTNLIDVTESITTALYFATCDYPDDTGFIYIFDLSKMIRFTTRELGGKEIYSLFDTLLGINKTSFSQTNINLSEKIYDELNKIYSKNKDLFFEHATSVINTICGGQYREDTRDICVFEEIKANLLGINDKTSFTWFKDKVIFPIYKNNTNYISRYIISNAETVYKELSIPFKFEERSYNFGEDVVWLIALYKASAFLFVGNNINLFPKFPHILYYPDIIFDRMKSQRGMFIYQNYFNTFSLQKDSKEHIEYDIIIKISNKKRILNELDMLNINKSTLFPDADNIANYLKDNF